MDACHLSQPIQNFEFRGCLEASADTTVPNGTSHPRFHINQILFLLHKNKKQKHFFICFIKHESTAQGVRPQINNLKRKAKLILESSTQLPLCCLSSTRLRFRFSLWYLKFSFCVLGKTKILSHGFQLD